MNIEFYAILMLAGLFVLAVSVVIVIQHRLLKWLEERIKDADATIKDLQDRLMAKNLDNYKLWTQPLIEPTITEVEPPFNESIVGQISGQERINA